MWGGLNWAQDKLTAWLNGCTDGPNTGGQSEETVVDVFLVNFKKENLSSGKRNSPRRYAGWNHFLTVTRPRPPFPASTQTLLSVVSTRLHVFLGVSLIPLTSALWGGVGLYDDYTKQGGERSNQWRRPETMKGGENKKMLTNNKKGE